MEFLVLAAVLVIWFLMQVVLSTAFKRWIVPKEDQSTLHIPFPLWLDAIVAIPAFALALFVVWLAWLLIV
jgi:hypothetical protein